MGAYNLEGNLCWNKSLKVDTVCAVGSGSVNNFTASWSISAHSAASFESSKSTELRNFRAGIISFSSCYGVSSNSNLLIHFEAEVFSFPETVPQNANWGFGVPWKVGICWWSELDIMLNLGKAFRIGEVIWAEGMTGTEEVTWTEGVVVPEVLGKVREPILNWGPKHPTGSSSRIRELQCGY